ncbi:MAG TPA: ATP-binding protein [Rhodanobacter sp.]|nr:ATP-binding protein [Rhodanobacter sp.]
MRHPPSGFRPTKTRQKSTLRPYSKYLLARRSLVDPELNPVALRLHDEVGQWLALGILQIDGIRATRPELHELLGQLRTSLERATQSIREITQEFETAHDTSSLLAAIVHALTISPWAPYPLERILHPMLAELATNAAPLAPRAICELVGNAHRHAFATHIRLRVWCHDLTLHIEVDDDGIGAARVSDSQHFGLRSLRHQVACEKGSLNVRTRPGGGTRVTLDLPLHDVDTSLAYSQS